MTTKGHIAPVRSSVTLALLLVGAVTATACSSGSPAATPSAVSPGSSGKATSAASGASTPAAGKNNSSLNCQAIADAALDLNLHQTFLITLAGGGGSVLNRVDSPFYVDTTKLRADLDVLATLPDPTDATEISMMGKPSEAIPEYRQLLDLIDHDAGVNATPVAGATASSASDQQLLAFTAKFVRMSTAINSEVSEACPNVTANVPQAAQPGARTTPLVAGYQIGQTAPVGDLRVTLNKVVLLPGAGSFLLAAGSHYLFARVTIENTGKAAFSVNTIGGMYFEDSTGKQYYGDPFTAGMDGSADNFSTVLAAGGKQDGSVGFQVPENADDLVWVMEDMHPNRAVFTVKASDIATVGTPVSVATEDSMRADTMATQTAFVGMAMSAAATIDAAGTETPAPTEPAATDVPPDNTQAPDATQVPDDTQVPDAIDTIDVQTPPIETDTPEAVVTTDTPVSP